MRYRWPVFLILGAALVALLVFGLMGRGGHTVDETADLTTLPMQTQRAAILLYRLSQTLEGTP